jgi:uncharacterized protein YjaG (DUF416 family)
MRSWISCNRKILSKKERKKKLFIWMVLNYRHCKCDRMDPWYFIFAAVGAYEHSTAIYK